MQLLKRVPVRIRQQDAFVFCCFSELLEIYSLSAPDNRERDAFILKFIQYRA
jgi:hypothetical protein